MSSANLYSQKMIKIYRLIAIICFIVLAAAQISNILSNERTISFILLMINFMNLVLFLLLIIKPYRFGLMAIISFTYAVAILVFERISSNTMGLSMYVLTYVFLMARGFFRKHGKIKTILAVVIFFAMFISEIRFGVESFFSLDVISLLGFSLVLLLIIFFTYQISMQNNNSGNEKILHLSQFPELSNRDKEWLKLVQQETKYEVIANQYNVSFGTVRNRFHQIYKIIEVSDRIGFMATYGGYTLVD